MFSLFIPEHRCNRLSVAFCSCHPIPSFWVGNLSVTKAIGQFSAHLFTFVMKIPQHPNTETEKVWRYDLTPPKQTIQTPFNSGGITGYMGYRYRGSSHCKEHSTYICQPVSSNVTSVFVWIWKKRTNLARSLIPLAPLNWWWGFKCNILKLKV